MNGVKFLLDSCFIIRWRQQDEQAFCLFEQFNVEDGQQLLTLDDKLQKIYQELQLA